MKIINLIIGLAILPFFLFAQDSSVPLNGKTYSIIDRLEIKTGLRNPIHTAIQGYPRKAVVQYALAIDTAQVSLSVQDRRDLYYLFKDNNEWLEPVMPPTTLGGKNEEAFKKIYVDSSQTFYTIASSQADASSASDRYIVNDRPFLKYFYQTPANLFELTKKDFYLRVNPILNLKMGSLKEEEDPYFHNQRGVEIRGGIDDRIFFYSNILESQSRFPNYVNQRINRDLAVPGSGLYKLYSSSVFNIDNGFDYLNAQGYVGFNISSHVGLELGHGRHFIGNGYRSLLLSDYSNNYFYLKLSTRIWKLHYQNIFAELAVEGGRNVNGDVLLPKKYMATHYLSFDITKKLNIGIFETVVFSRNNHFEFQYLNPLILYRTVEGYIGSPDNVLLGTNGKWNLFNRFQLYGQLVLDEFQFSELIQERRGWWGNKLGIQAGLKYIDLFGIDHLDLRLEYNTVRPYTYTHRDSTASYTHQNQPLAHPIGANFKEIILGLRYQPLKRLTLNARLINSTFGEDGPSDNWGTNILLPNTTREAEFGNSIGQGIEAKTLIARLDISYELYHNTYLDLHFFYRNLNSEDDARDQKTTYFGGGFRMNFANRDLDF